MAPYISRSYVGMLSEPDDCALTISDKFGMTSLPQMMVVVDADARCYASGVSTTMEKMVMSGRMALIGTYTSKCPLVDIADDIRETAKEYGISA